MLKNIKTEEKMINYLTKRIRALENINAAYRTHGRPSSVALDNASDTFGWKETLAKYKEIKKQR